MNQASLLVDVRDGNLGVRSVELQCEILRTGAYGNVDSWTVRGKVIPPDHLDLLKQGDRDLDQLVKASLREVTQLNDGINLFRVGREQGESLIMSACGRTAVLDPSGFRQLADMEALQLEGLSLRRLQADVPTGDDHIPESLTGRRLANLNTGISAGRYKCRVETFLKERASDKALMSE
jgi:hypothetical protein